MLLLPYTLFALDLAAPHGWLEVGTQREPLTGRLIEKPGQKAGTYG